MNVARLGVVVLLLPLIAPAQEKPKRSDKSDPKPQRVLSKEQVAERLEATKTDLLPKVWPPKCDTDEQYKKHYLAKWQAIQSDHYLVFTNGPTDSCKTYAVTLEMVYAYVKKELPFEDIDHLLTAYIFADAEDYYRFSVAITGYSEEGARQTAGHSAGDYYATYYSSPRSAVVYHEATHQIVSECLKVHGVGSWFQEGLAVYFEKKITNDRPQGDAKSDLKHGDCYPLAEFMAIPVLLSDPNGNGHRNYAHAGALIDFMINTRLEPVAGKFTAFLDAARTEQHGRRDLEVSRQLVKAVYGLSLEAFEALWRKHLGIR